MSANIATARGTFFTATSVSRRRKRNSGGNAIIECAFTLVPLFALICAFADLSLMLYRWSTLQNAVREGCRYAITFQTTGVLGQSASIEQVVQQYAMGVVKTTDNPQHIFVNYYAPASPNTPIANGGNVPGNIIQVSVQNVSWSWLAPLSGTIGVNPFYASGPFSLNVYSCDILGGYPAGVNSVPQ
jgi:Flp pilus assembly protein TadG